MPPHTGVRLGRGWEIIHLPASSLAYYFDSTAPPGTRVAASVANTQTASPNGMSLSRNFSAGNGVCVVTVAPLFIGLSVNGIVLHSFWIPSFLAKIDAVPGRTTTMSLTPTKTGSFQTDPNLRVQCAELCGLRHSTMAAHVAVVTEQEFEEWVADQQALSAGAEQPTPVTGAQEFTIIGENNLFDVDEIQVEASGQVVMTFDNRDLGVPHNWAVYESEEAATSGGAPIAGSTVENGLLTQTIVFDAPEPGTYFFRCDVHPTTMTGVLEVR